MAASFCHIVTHEILTIGNLTDAMLNGPRSQRTRALIRKHIKPLVDDTAGLSKPFTQIAIGPKGFAELKQHVGEMAIELSAHTFTDPVFNHERAERVERIMRERMEALTPEEFQDLLRFRRMKSSSSFSEACLAFSPVWRSWFLSSTGSSDPYYFSPDLPLPVHLRQGPLSAVTIPQPWPANHSGPQDEPLLMHAGPATSILIRIHANLFIRTSPL